MGGMCHDDNDTICWWRRVSDLKGEFSKMFHGLSLLAFCLINEQSPLCFPFPGLTRVCSIDQLIQRKLFLETNLHKLNMCFQVHATWSLP